MRHSRCTGMFAAAIAIAQAGAWAAQAAAEAPAIVAVDDAPDSNQQPVAVFSAYPPQGSAPLSVNLDGSDSADLDGTIAVYAWDLGDSSAPAFGPVVDHHYAVAGTYPVTLTVTDNEGSAHQRRQTVVIVSPEAGEPSTLVQPSIDPPAPEPVAAARETSLVVSVTDPSGQQLPGADLVVRWPLGVQTARVESGVVIFATGDQTLPADWLGKAVTITATAGAHQPQSRQIVIVAGLENALTLTLSPQELPRP